MNEITVKIKCSINELIEELKSKGFQLQKKITLSDTYFIPENLKLKNLSVREIISKAILLRDIFEYLPEEKHIIKLTFKQKDIDREGRIVAQDKTDCNILDIHEGKEFLNKIGYKPIMDIKEEDVEYSKDGLTLGIKDIINGDKLVEVETVEGNERLNTTEKLIEEIENLNISIYNDNYFVKKAEIELEKIMN